MMRRGRWGGRERFLGGPDTRERYVGRVHSLPRSFATSPFITSTPSRHPWG
jgi:hypothetical protein